MTAPFHSPAPWQVHASGGARTIVAHDRSVVAVVCGSNGAAPFEVGNGALLAAAPAMRDALREALEWIEGEGSIVPERLVGRIRAALAKSEQDGGAPEDGPVETGTGL